MRIHISRVFKRIFERPSKYNALTMRKVRCDMWSGLYVEGLQGVREVQGEIPDRERVI